MIRAILGFLKGLLVGGGVGYGLFRLGLGADNAILTYLACTLVGALVGVICGRAPWRSETIWTPVVKALFGGVIGAGLCAVGLNVVPEATLLTQPIPLSTHGPAFLSTVIGVLYGTFVEIDDGGNADDKKAAGKAGKKT